MLADGTPVDVIVERTGASRATVFRRKANRLRGMTGDVVWRSHIPYPAAEIQALDDLARDLAMWEQHERSLGLPTLAELAPGLDLDLMACVFGIDLKQP